MRDRCNHIVQRCINESDDTNKTQSNLEMAFKEMGMKEEQFNQILTLLRDLENNESHIIELMFLYKLNEKDELDREAKKVTHDFHSGALDPNNKNSKYEQQMAKKKTKEERIRRKRQDRVDFEENA